MTTATSTANTSIASQLNCPADWVIANWKMNPVATDEALALVDALDQKLSQETLTCHVALAPSFLHLTAVAQTLADRQTSLVLSAQNLCAYRADKGAYTGEVSAQQLADVGVRQVIIGHSERRAYFAESDAVLSQKIACAIEAGLDVIFCVGETEAQYDDDQTLAVIKAQLSVLAEFSSVFAKTITEASDNTHSSRLIVAYEPVWAIGTGKVPTVAEVDTVHAAIKAQLANLAPSLQYTPILYGGSVKADNAADFAQSPNINGVLVGGASLDAESFYQIIHAFSQN